MYWRRARFTRRAAAASGTDWLVSAPEARYGIKAKLIKSACVTVLAARPHLIAHGSGLSARSTAALIRDGRMGGEYRRANARRPGGDKVASGGGGIRQPRYGMCTNGAICNEKPARLRLIDGSSGIARDVGSLKLIERPACRPLSTSAL